MFNTGTKVYIPIGLDPVPGVVAGEPEATTYTNRRGVQVRSMQVPVISFRRIDGRAPWFQLSYESATLLSVRDETVEELDIALADLWAKQRDSLQAYLASRRPVGAANPKARASA